MKLSPVSNPIVSPYGRMAASAVSAPLLALVIASCSSGGSGSSGIADSPDAGGSAGADAAVRAPNLSRGFGTAGDSSKCSTGFQWNAGNSSSSQMRPGGNCITCHAASFEGPRYTIAGTVMGGLADINDCAGVPGVIVEITDSNGVKSTMTSNPAGNFFSRRVVAMPYTAKLIGADGTERGMVAAQTDLNCATCHTDTGVNGAPGRIIAP